MHQPPVSVKPKHLASLTGKDYFVFLVLNLEYVAMWVLQMQIINFRRTETEQKSKTDQSYSAKGIRINFPGSGDFRI